MRGIPAKMWTAAAMRERIEEWSIPIPFVGCWLWLRSIGSHGYGQMSVNSRPRTAHRLSYEAFNSAVPPGLEVRHTCDNRWCVNPDHLIIGTHTDNMRDMHLRGRAAKAALGKPSPRRSLTLEQASAVRASHQTDKALARRCGVSSGVISRVRSGATYQDAVGVEPGPLPLRPISPEAAARADEIMRAAMLEDTGW